MLECQQLGDVPPLELRQRARPSRAEEIGAASGLVLEYDGTTTEQPSDSREAFLPLLYGDRWAPVLVGWASPDQVVPLEGDVAGLAYSRSARDGRTGSVHSVTGQVVLDLDLRRFDTPTYVGVLRHELAHLVGLGHVEDESQIMHESAAVTSLQAGDLTGLAAVGAGPCAPQL